MSYCRFSSDNFMCDVYVYEDCYGGFTTHVAANRFAFPPLPPIPIGASRFFGGKWNGAGVSYPSKWHKRAATVYYWLYAKWETARGFSLDHIPRRRIELPHAGKRFNDETPTECANRLKELRELGYNVPDRAITALLAEDDANLWSHGGKET